MVMVYGLGFGVYGSGLRFKGTYQFSRLFY